MIISERLIKVCSFINKNDKVADIGTDHGLAAIFLAKSHQASFVYASDISKGPLENAQNNIEKYNVQELVKTIQSPGIEWINTHIDSCIISGLGSQIITDILKHDTNLIDRYIICPSNDAQKIRTWIKDKKYFIEAEEVIFEKDYFYEIIIINKKTGYKIKNKSDEIFGPILRRKKDNIWTEYWAKKLNHLSNLLLQIPKKDSKYKKIQKNIKLINKVIHWKQVYEN